MKNTKVLMSALVGVGVATAALFVPSNPVFADSKTEVMNGINQTGSGSNTDIPGLIAAVVNFLSFVVGALSVIMVIYGGFRYVTSGGDSGKVSGAKNTIVYALIGLLIVVLAQVIVKFVLEKAIGA